MGILSFYLGIENLGSSLDFSPPFVTRNHDISLSLELAGKPCLTTYRAKSRGYCRNGKFHHLVHTFLLSFFLIPSSNVYLYNIVSLLVLQLQIVLS